MDKLRIGTGGVPTSAASRSTLDGVRRSRELGLDAMEVEYVRGVKVSEESAREVGELAKELDISLSAHGPYYINLASLEKQKVGASRRYILDTARACHWLGADRFTFHPAYYQSRDPEVVYGLVEEQLDKILAERDQNGWDDVSIRPELTGKPTQFGNLQELINLAKQHEGLVFCIDFAHAHARSGGHSNGYDAFARILQTIKDELGQSALEDMHMHVSGIEYSEKGERNHLPFVEADLKWQELLEAFKDFGVKGQLVVESPILEEDALLLKRYWDKISPGG